MAPPIDAAQAEAELAEALRTPVQEIEHSGEVTYAQAGHAAGSGQANP